MAIVVKADFPSISPEAYQKTHADLLSDGRPDGMIAHCCSAKDGGISIIDIWESQEHFQAFAATKIAAVMQKHSIEGGPENLVIDELINADAFDFQGTVRSS